MIGKKINQLATELAPATTDLTIIGDPTTGVSKKITLSQIANLFATSGTVTSVAVTETGDALTITGSPITTAGTINIGFAGAATQYVRGDGQLSDFPTSTGGGSSVSYYLNSSVSQGTLGGVAYRQFSKTPIAGAGTDISVSANGYIASYITDANDPALLEVPAGNFNCEFYFSVNSNNHNPYVYAEVYKYDGTTFTLLGSSQSVPEYLTNGTTLSPYYFAVPVTATVLTITDRIAIRIYANVDGRTVTLHTENNHLCQVVTTFSKGLTSLNNLTRQVQFLATGTSGTDFNIASSTATHTFNLPTASATNRGALSSADWTTFNNKQNALTNPITGTGASGQVAFFNGTTSVTGTNNFFWDTANNRLGIGLTNPQRSIEIYNTTADNHLRLSGNAPSVSMGEAVTGSVYQAKFGLVTTNGQFVSAGVAGDFVIISQTGATIIGTSSTEKMRVNTSGNVSINNTNDTYKLDVTGTARLTGQLRLESTITDGTNTYTLPSATGTLALTSQLTGGTVTSVGLSSATSGVTIGSTPITTSGTITLAIATASGSQQGLLSSTDWTTFNNKQNALTNPVTGIGTTNYLPKFTGASTIGNSSISDNGTGRVSIGTTSFNDSFVISNSGAAGWEFSNTGSVITYNRSTAAYIPMTFQASSFSFTGAATFSGAVGINGVGPTYPLYVRVGTNQRFRVVDGGSGYTQLASLNDAENAYTPIMLGNSWLSIASTGAATFSSSVTATTINLSSELTINRSTASSTYLIDLYNSHASNNAAYTTFRNAGVTMSIGVERSVGGAIINGGAYTGVITTVGTKDLNLATNEIIRLTLNGSTGNVGIGLTNPTGKLHSYIGDITAGNAPASSGTTPVNAMLNLTNNRGVGMYFGGSYSGTYAQWIQVSDVGNLGVNYPLALNPNGGNVGIGTTSPSSKLDILGANEVMNIAGTNATSAYTGYYYNTSTLVGYIGNGSSILSGAASSDFIFRSQGALVYAAGGNTERMRITSGGNVLIGTTSDTGQKLQISGAASANYWRVFGTNGLSGYLIQSGDWEGNASTDLAVAAEAPNIRFYTNGSATERMRIKSTGIINLSNVPSSSAGLSSGDIYKSAGVLMIV